MDVDAFTDGPEKLLPEEYRSFGKEKQDKLQEEINQQYKKTFSEKILQARKKIAIEIPPPEPPETLRGTIVSTEAPVPFTSSEPPPNPPQTLSWWNRGMIARIRRGIGEAIGREINDENPATEIVPTSELPPLTASTPPLLPPETLITPQPAVVAEPAPLPPPVLKEESDDKLSLVENAKRLLDDTGVMVLIEAVKGLRDNGNGYERIMGKKEGPATNYARLVNFARHRFPLNDRTKTYELVFRFLSPGQRAGALEISLDEFAQMRERMLLLSEALIDSQFNGQMPTLIAECLSLYDAYSLESGQLLKRRDLFRIANQVLALNGKGDPWQGIDPQIRKHFTDIAANIALQSS